MKWSDRRLLDLFGIDHPIIQAPMAGASSGQMAIAVSQAGGLGSVPRARPTAEQLGTGLPNRRQGAGGADRVHFCGPTPPAPATGRAARSRDRRWPNVLDLG